jgi:hypothetical protein
MKREIEEKGAAPDRQAGSRKGRDTMDNVYILDHLAKSELKKKEGRKQNRKSELVQVFVLYLQRESHGQGASERGSKEGEQGSRMCLGNRREKVGRSVREKDDDVRKEIFEMAARSGQRNTRVHSERRVQEEKDESH